MSTIEYLRQRLRYEPETGALIWLASTSTPNNWNARFVGKRAGSRRADGYRILAIDHQHRYLASRLIYQIVTGSVPTSDIDHKNGDPSDDRWDNLRLATKSQNVGNSKRQIRGTSGFKGVTKWRTGRWKAQIKKDYKNYYLGIFDTPEEAHSAYMVAAQQYFGEFARAE